jgi:hypothetical protein
MIIGDSPYRTKNIREVIIRFAIEGIIENVWKEVKSKFYKLFS